MRLMYVAGPYRDESWGEVKRNVARAADVSAELLRYGFAVICPHTMTHTFEMYQLPDEAFLACGLEQVRRCDGMVLVDGGKREWWESSGTRSEVALAMERGLPVYPSAYFAFNGIGISYEALQDYLKRGAK